MRFPRASDLSAASDNMIFEALLSRLIHLASAKRDFASRHVRMPFDFTADTQIT